MDCSIISVESYRHIAGLISAFVGGYNTLGWLNVVICGPSRGNLTCNRLEAAVLLPNIQRGEQGVYFI
jgi:hypothetical protein